jgi:hypothetical protein
MGNQVKILFRCSNIFGDIWKVFWIEHGGPRSKFVQSESEPKFESFADIKSAEEISEKDVLKQRGFIR